MRLRRWAVKSTGWVPSRIDFVISGARKASGNVRLISLASIPSCLARSSIEPALPLVRLWSQPCTSRISWIRVASWESFDGVSPARMSFASTPRRRKWNGRLIVTMSVEGEIAVRLYLAELGSRDQ